MEIIKKKDTKDPHPYIPELKELYSQGRITRREFLRNSTLLGLSAAAAYAFISPFSAKKAMAATPKRGGTWKCAMRLQRLDHPARLSWNEGANVVRQVAEHLTESGPDNITRPRLCEKWVASDDVKTWDLYIRKGVKFNNGAVMNADDVLFTMKDWFDKDVGSSMLGLLSYWGGMQNVEKIDDYHIRLHLKHANIGVPEHLFHYPGVILHRSFEGDFIKKPVGTGPYMLTEFAEGQRAAFKRRTDYWQKGADGKSLPYLDGLMYIDMGKDAGFAALQAGQVDSIMNPRTADILGAKGNPNIISRSVDTAQTFVTRMRVDLPPWDDNRVRTALKKSQDRTKILKLAAYGWGTEAIDAHISPAHPEYCEKPIPAYDPKGARALLEEYAKEKGLKLPLKVKLATKNDQAEADIAQALKQMAAPAGFDIKLDITEPSGYWDRWTEVDLGITSWTHRVLGTMVLPLAYVKEAIGAWNETRWYDDEFTTKLRQAEKTLDVEKRRAIFCDLEQIMQDRGPVAVPYWRKVFNLCSAKFDGVSAHPSSFHVFPREMWKKS